MPPALRCGCPHRGAQLAGQARPQWSHLRLLRNYNIGITRRNARWRARKPAATRYEASPSLAISPPDPAPVTSIPVVAGTLAGLAFLQRYHRPVCVCVVVGWPSPCLRGIPCLTNHRQPRRASLPMRKHRPLRTLANLRAPIFRHPGLHQAGRFPFTK